MKRMSLVTVVFLTGLFFLTAQTTNIGNPVQGKTLFQKHCSSCHGKSGGGLGPSTHMPNFSDKHYQELRSNLELFNKITKGTEESGMPAWEKILSPEERWNLVAYIKTLSK